MANQCLALLAHGFNVRDKGQGTIGRLLPFLTSHGIESIMFDMGWMGLIQVRAQNRRHAKRLALAATNAKRQNRTVLAIGHSNGCCVIHLAASLYAAPIDHVIYINPALNADAEPSAQLKSIHVWHSPSDMAVKVAKLLPAHDWGDMGAIGYTGSDPRVTNYNKELMAVRSDKHSDFATESKLAFYGPLIIEELLHAINDSEGAALRVSTGPDLWLPELQPR